MKKLTQSEWEIMDILWGADHPLSRSEILEHPGERGWKDSSLHILINSMLEKGAIQVAGYQKTGSHYGRTFAPAFTQSQYAVSQLRSMGIGERGKNQVVRNFFSDLLEGLYLDEDTLEELEQMLKEKRGRRK